MDTAFVTGATGFVGASVVRTLLNKGFSVRALVRKNSDRKNLKGLSVEAIEGDLLDSNSLRAACRGARYAFHVAADYRVWIPDPESMYASNVQGTRNVLEAAAASDVERIVHCSSVAAVKVPKDPRYPANESSVYAGTEEIIGVYKKSKWLSEQAAMDAARKGVPVVVVNPAAPIGPYDIKPTPTGRIVLDFLNGKMPSYIDTGLNIIHVRDVAQGHYHAALHGRIGERYILGCRNITLKEMLATLSRLTGLQGPRFKTPYRVALAFAAVDTWRARIMGGEPIAPLDAVRMAKHYMFFDSSKAVRELELPQTPVASALKDAAAWFLENGYVKNSNTVNRALAYMQSQAKTPVEAGL